jgi:pimeloyl-ACP methyl ester carboxylesterase
MRLFYQKLGQGPPVFILHGLFGSGDNWITVAHKLSDRYTVYLIDLRNHGRSPHSEINTYNAMVEDLVEIVYYENLSKIHLTGHSMGGKVAMLFGTSFPEKVSSLTVIDIAPDGYGNNTHNTEVMSHINILNAMSMADLSKVNNRNDGDRLLSVSIPDMKLRQFIMKNLKRNSDNSFIWRINIQALTEYLPEIMGPLPYKSSIAFPVLFIKGEYSGYLSDKHLSSVTDYFPRAKIITIPGAGHWIQADQPDLLIDILRLNINNIY